MHTNIIFFLNKYDYMSFMMLRYDMLQQKIYNSHSHSCFNKNLLPSYLVSANMFVQTITM